MICLCITHNQKDEVIAMHRYEHGVFLCHIDEDCLNEHFLVRSNGAWTECIDPYNWFCGADSKYSVVQSFDELPMPERIPMPKLTSNCDAIIYEANIRDLTSMPNLSLKHPKKFKGFTEENETTKEKSYGFLFEITGIYTSSIDACF